MTRGESVAQLVERWTPGSEIPGSRRSGARYMYIYETPDWDGPVGGSSRGQLKSVEWDDFDGHVKLLFLNSPNNPEFSDRTVGVGACATSTA